MTDRHIEVLHTIQESFRAQRNHDPERERYYMDRVEALDAAIAALKRQRVPEGLERIGMVQLPDPYDEQDGLWMDHAALKRLRSLPYKTVIYAAAPEPD